MSSYRLNVVIGLFQLPPDGRDVGLSGMHLTGARQPRSQTPRLDEVEQ
jgi:hypothetical protein